ncbi:3580_t:CDS:2, partial [Paraglomus occultum]
FTKIKEEILEDKKKRLLKASWRINEPNVLVLEVLPKPLSYDKRKKDWVLIKAVDEEKHWHEVKQTEIARSTLSKCKGCKLNQNQTALGCERWIDEIKVQEEISDYIRKHKQQILELDQEMINSL